VWAACPVVGGHRADPPPNGPKRGVIQAAAETSAAGPNLRIIADGAGMVAGMVAGSAMTGSAGERRCDRGRSSAGGNEVPEAFAGGRPSPWTRSCAPVR